MRVRKDLLHAWVGWSHNGRARLCPACRVSHSVKSMMPIRDTGPDGTWTQPYRCDLCGFTFTMRFLFAGGNIWRCGWIYLGVKR